MKHLRHISIQVIILLGISLGIQKLAIAQLACTPEPQAMSKPSFRTPPSPAPHPKIASKTAIQTATEQGNYETVAKLWRQAIDKSGATGSKYYELGEALRFQGKFGQAITAYKTAIQITPENKNRLSYESVCDAWGRATAQNSEKLSAEDFMTYRPGVTTCVNIVLARHSDHYAIHERMGRFLYYKGQTNDTIQILQKAIRLMPCNIDLISQGKAINALLDLLIRDKQWLELQQTEAFLLKRYPDHKLAILRIKAWHLYTRRHIEKATRAYTTVLELDPTNKWAKAMLQEIATQKSQKKT
ncbi:tetratricopeptide repeat protein [filamentous cyanobacterium LEGE 11480]|uniref:Tetratricopeptide repeat protein n=1 Tax=Romeriopsis navalis LEGE 11480 TaxID=2777977 RepID=A0A928Z3M8_9CYAN|nr:tetratricopeptide repeat protein [Romeriopsis navalis]MBE9030182.1 tetratricopeptide repeat protein [Romeriopsis navalis LEGE 11480]